MLRKSERGELRRVFGSVLLIRVRRVELEQQIDERSVAVGAGIVRLVVMVVVMRPGVRVRMRMLMCRVFAGALDQVEALVRDPGCRRNCGRRPVHRQDDGHETSPHQAMLTKSRNRVRQAAHLDRWTSTAFYA
jgi:hypothetical protein